MINKEDAEKMKRNKDSGDLILFCLLLFVVFLALGGMSGCVYRIWTG